MSLRKMPLIRVTPEMRASAQFARAVMRGGYAHLAFNAMPARQGKPASIRELERALRDLGFSQREAAAIAAHGYRAITNPATDDDEECLGEALHAIKRAAQSLKGN